MDGSSEQLLNEQQIAALVFVTQALQKQEIRFVIIGGLAAIAHGANRPSADIDIVILDGKFNEAALLFEDHILHAPRHYTKNNWDIMQCVLEYEGVQIDLCDAGHFKTTASGKIEPLLPDPIPISLKTVCGIIIPTLTREALYSYKKRLGREVDLQDIHQLEKITE